MSQIPFKIRRARASSARRTVSRNLATTREEGHSLVLMNFRIPTKVMTGSISRDRMIPGPETLSLVLITIPLGMVMLPSVEMKRTSRRPPPPPQARHLTSLHGSQAPPANPKPVSTSRRRMKPSRPLTILIPIYLTLFQILQNTVRWQMQLGKSGP